ncbi:hypothetical protein crov101 [Cafeteria roenbergensis virus]|uniref:Uncharacterized protein n=1 Tax=Cafeteria roenbergensis virus (strain BV-PW1) TaxID=693272 RepID=E3T4M1_CROVB|nr:hypothetical protein crov101 [Cafeteria roenbergensis virus BV-PW1]ADO67134.1 hypothetical protein crov101 [Cafeteria roenbergensis virus BV-PW1]
MAAQIVKDFNCLVEALIQQTAPLTGNAYHRLFKNLIRINSLLPIQTFNQYALEWKTHIENKNESFFLKEDIIKSTTGDTDVLQKIFQLQGVWKNLDNNSKENLWEMMGALLTLGENYQQLKR